MAHEDKRKSYADYIKSYLKTNPPKGWTGDFPGSQAKIDNYIEHILRKGEDHKKVKAIDERFNLVANLSATQKMIDINGRTRSLYDFLKKDGTKIPYRRNLELTAIIFGVPITTHYDFLKQNAQQENSETETPDEILEETPPEISEEPKISEEKNTTPKELESSEEPEEKTKKTAQTTFKTIAVSLFLVAIFSGFVYTIFFTKVTTKNENMQISSVMPVDIGDKFFDGEISKTETNPNDTGLIFYTRSIFNDYCLTKNEAWNFEVDTNGEDMKNPEFGSMFAETIQELYPHTVGRVNIANITMELRFEIKNSFDKTMCLENMMIRVLDKYDTKAEKATYNVYQDRDLEQSVFITFSTQKTYRFALERTSLKKNETISFKCTINGDSHCDNKIYRFKIVADFLDVNSRQHYYVESDKTYLIGFVRD